MKFIDNTVYAAGTICWRMIDGVLHLLVIHRTLQQDDSFPKGKVDPGESLPAAAVRETWEETGLDVSLGVPLGFVQYSLGNGKTKEVHYWCAKVTEKAAKKSNFVSNDEVESIRWVPVHQVADELTYDLDREVFERFVDVVSSDALNSFSLTLLRHAKALDPLTYHEPDKTRPLATRGRHQAESIVEALAAFGPQKVISSSSIRCLQTIEPFVLAYRFDVKEVDGISQHKFDGDPTEVRALVLKRIDKKKNTIICSHGPVLPVLVSEIMDATETAMTNKISSASHLDTAAFTVVHLRVDDPTSPVIAIETHDPLV